MKHPLLLSLLALLATSALAQDPATTQNTQATTDAGTTATTADVTTTAATTADDANVPALADATPSTQTPAPTTTAVATTTRKPNNDDGNIPTYTSNDGHYSYPPPSVPPTHNAPFMHQSDLPQGTVFIIVGAILGAFGASILLWRAVIGCLLHRSVKRAALEQHRANDKMGIPGVPTGAAGAAMAPPFYTYTEHASNGSLGAVNPSAGRGVRRTQRGPMPSATPSQTNLFFSPTAPTGAQQANRSSTFLPSGFYAAGQGAPQQGHGHGHNMSASDLRPGSSGLGRHSDSPGPMPRADPQRRNVSNSSANMARPTSQRPPSMFLDDLLGDQSGHYPPPSHNQNWGHSRDRL